MIPPDIFDYSDYRPFLTAWLEFKKNDPARAKLPPYSHRMFAREAGLANVGTLASVISGSRHLTEALLKAFLVPLGLEEPDAQFLGMLATAAERRKEEAKLKAALQALPESGAQQAVKRRTVLAWQVEQAEGALREAEDALVGARRMHRAELLNAARSRLMGEWYIAAILELSKCVGFRRDPAWIAAALRAKVTPEEVQQALHVLEEAGQLHDQAGGAESSATPLVTADAVDSAAVRRSYEGYFARSLDAFHSTLDTREFGLRCRLGALTIAVPSSEVPRLREHALQTRKDLFQFMEGLQGTRDSVYVALVHVFPITEVLQEVTVPKDSKGE